MEWSGLNSGQLCTALDLWIISPSLAATKQIIISQQLALSNLGRQSILGLLLSEGRT